MNTTVTLNLSEFVYKFGTEFFNLQEDEWTPLVDDDLTYEETEKEGINGYVLKIEEQLDEYSSSFSKYIMAIYNWFRSFLFKQPLADEQDIQQKIKRNWKNTEQCIHNSVRNRLLDKLNEDLDKWGIAGDNKGMSMPKYHHPRESSFGNSLINIFNIYHKSHNKPSPVVHKNTFKE